MPKKGPLEKAREALIDIWNECFSRGCVGRCWGQRGEESLSELPGSNIILSDGIVIIFIFQEKGHRYGKLQIKEFGPEKSDLKDRVINTLTGAGLM